MSRYALIASLVALAAGAIYFYAAHENSPTAVPYRLGKVDRGEVVATVNATGTINPTTTVIVGSQLSGQVVEILVDYNSEVQAGDIVARLNSDQVRARLDAARADLEQARAGHAVQEAQISRVQADIQRAKASEADAQAQVTRNEALLGDAERGLQRQSDLRMRGATTDAALETARANRDALRASLDSSRAQLAQAFAASLGLQAEMRVAQAQLLAAQAQIAQREAMARQIEVDLGNTDIRSPVSGTVIQRNVELGQAVAASLQSPTLFLIANDLRHLEISANIDESDVGRVKPGQRVAFTVSAYPHRSFEGELRQVRLGSQVVQNVVIYTAIISVENARQELLPGMTANLSIETDRRNNVLRVSNAALRWRPPSLPSEKPASFGTAKAMAGVPVSAYAGAHEEGPAQPGRLYVVGRNSEPEAIDLQLGISNGEVTELIGGSVTSGMEVIVGGGPRPPSASARQGSPRFGF